MPPRSPTRGRMREDNTPATRARSRRARTQQEWERKQCPKSVPPTRRRALALHETGPKRTLKAAGTLLKLPQMHLARSYRTGSLRRRTARRSPSRHMSPLIGVILVLTVVATATIFAAVSRSFKTRFRICVLDIRMFLWWAAGKGKTSKKTEPDNACETFVVDVG